MANLAALYDTSVLYPAPLRDLLMQLALSDLYRAHSTNDIHDEWIRNVLGNRPDLTPEQLDRTRALMNSSVRDCLVENYRELIPALDLPDLDDRHVLAAAIVANADIIVTFNLRDFSRENLEMFGIEAQHPDEFIGHLLDVTPSTVISAVATVRTRLQNPPQSAAEYIDIIERQRLPNTAAVLREYENQI